jgi:hypothetical protein
MIGQARVKQVQKTMFPRTLPWKRGLLMTYQRGIWKREKKPRYGRKMPNIAINTTS